MKTSKRFPNPNLTVVTGSGRVVDTARLQAQAESLGEQEIGSYRNRLAEYNRKYKRQEGFAVSEDERGPEDVAPPFTASPFDPGKWKIIKPREWLYGGHYIRSYVTGTSAPSKQGKSTLVLAEGISMATGFDLLRVGADRMPKAPLKVWIWNGEETEEELARRIKAICLYYGRMVNDSSTDEPEHERFDFDFESLRGNLYLDSGRDKPLKIAALEGHGNVTVAVPVVKDMIYTINANDIDVTIIDPFINAHKVPENSEHMDEVVGAFKDIAYQTGSAIENVHHTRKGQRGGGDVTSEDSRGSSSILAAWRDSRVLNVMDEATAKEQGVKNRLRYIRVDSDRPNMTARGERIQWCYLENVSLGNATTDRPADDVGVTVPWSPRVKSAADKKNDAVRILDAVLELLDGNKRVTKQTGGDYTIADLVPYLKRTMDIKASAKEIRAVLLEASEGKEAVIEYNNDGKRGAAGYRRIKPAA